MRIGIWKEVSRERKNVEGRSHVEKGKKEKGENARK
jgi:hypothetical protein